VNFPGFLIEHRQDLIICAAPELTGDARRSPDLEVAKWIAAVLASDDKGGEGDRTLGIY
jgi:hypothetical protein